MRKFKEWLNIQLIKSPGRMVLGAIILFNILFFLLSSVIISNFSLSGTENMGFMEAAFCTLTMILDAGCIQFVVADIGTANVVVAIICLVVILIGMVSFTGAVIGYITNYISKFIENADVGAKRLKISDHSVILNWNSRASEIINDLMYCATKQKVVVLVDSRKKEIEKEISERLADTIHKENALLLDYCRKQNFGYFKTRMYMHKNAFKNNVTYIVREGDVFSSKQLLDISLDKAKMIIILGSDIQNSACKYEMQERSNEKNKGNSQTVKTLMQVADITAAETSSDNQKIIVEITDDWTAELVQKIIRSKQVDGKCNIVPIMVNQVLGHILSQFSLMPELNLAYRELFSNRGAAFHTEEGDEKDEIEFVKKYLKNHRHAIPLTCMSQGGKTFHYFSADSEKNIKKTSDVKPFEYSVLLNPEYWIERKNVIILGHNNRCDDIMQGFESFRGEWQYADGHDEIVRVVVIDDKEHLEKENYYKKYPFVIKTVAAEIYDKDLICSTINDFVSSNTEDTSVLILSDDRASNEDIDAKALANLVYVQDIVKDKVYENPDFDVESIDVIVEIIDPKHHDVVNSYSTNNVVISNRYISKMITQIGEKEALFGFYNDILTYDVQDETIEGVETDSKEIYIKKISRLFTEIPKDTTADVFVRALYEASVDASLPPDKINPTLALGYVKPGGDMTLFAGDLSQIRLHFEKHDKLILFSSH